MTFMISTSKRIFHANVRLDIWLAKPERLA
jgi:hypothetical protein